MQYIITKLNRPSNENLHKAMVNLYTYNRTDSLNRDLILKI